MRRFALLVALAVPCAASAATPPPLLNYQGVLRDASNAPLSGSYDMVFRFMSAAERGDEILVDQHTAALGGAVAVSSGLFSATLGGGAVSDGSGPGIYTSLERVFRDYDTVWLQITIGGETLAPNVRIVAAAYAMNASNLNGMPASSYLDVSSTDQSKAGKLTANRGVEGYNFDVSTSGSGVYGRGWSNGGTFVSSDSASWAYAGSGEYGLMGWGKSVGGYFQDNTTNTSVSVGYLGRGIESTNVTLFGAHFKMSANANEAYLAYSGDGVRGVGTTWGVHGQSAHGGGYFEDTDSSGEAYAGWGDTGVAGYGTSMGGFFEDTDDMTAAYLGYGPRGIWAVGTFAGGTFSSPDQVSFWADVSTPVYKIHGTGAVAFAQNHPYQQDKVVVYAAPEGDEVAVYTRGSARLVHGEARVALGDTFRLVANPDLGLTAHLTPRGEPIPLAVESVSTSEIVVRGPQDSGAAFDYIVYGLRIGFEDLAVIQPKDREAFLPDDAAIDEPYSAHPELRAFNARERFKRMRRSLGIPGEPDLSRAQALAAAVDANRSEFVAQARAAIAKDGLFRPSGGAASISPIPSGPPSGGRASSSGAAPAAPTVAATPAVAASRAPGDPYPLVPLSGAADAGTVLVLDPTTPGAVRPADTAFDRGVAGCAVAPADGTQIPSGFVAAGTSGVVACKVDAGFGAIAVGDLLTTSANPGHAMRSGEEAHGAILGKAMEPLAQGTGTIRVLVVLR